MLDLSSHYTADGTRQTTAAEWLARGLYEISQILITTPAPDSLGRVLETLCSLLELRGALLTFVDSDGLRTTEESSWPLQPTGELRGWAHQVIEQVLNDSMPVVVENAWVELAPQPGSDVEHVESELDVSLVGVPIVSGDKLDGALVILRQHSAGDQAAFSFDSDVRLMSSVARISAVSWQLANVSAAEPVPEVAPHPPGDSAAIGRAMCWRAALHTAQTAAKTNATVLLRGETGVGKSLVARLVHEASPRHERPFVAINCAALPENLLESELFGHERGAFTGAMNRRLGRFELAHTGTLFLDEIGEISTAFQAKLLRVLQQGEFERVGGTETISVDVRVVAATHRDLEAAVRAGTFRADLYYRLCVVPVRVPALRERPQDIALLARTFLDRFNAENGTDRSLDDTALAALGAHPFPGNVRELENAVRRAATLSRHRWLRAEDFSFLAETSALFAERQPSHTVPPLPESSTPGHDLRISPRTPQALTRTTLIEALDRSGWVLAKAARLLGISARQVGYAIQKHGIILRKY